MKDEEFNIYASQSTIKHIIELDTIEIDGAIFIRKDKVKKMIDNFSSIKIDELRNENKKLQNSLDAYKKLCDQKSRIMKSWVEKYKLPVIEVIPD